MYWLVNRFRPETREFFHKRCIGYCSQIFERWCPHVVVSVHPLTQHIFARVLANWDSQIAFHLFRLSLILPMASGKAGLAMMLRFIWSPAMKRDNS